MNPKVKKALDLIQHAQSIIGEEAQELCSVDKSGGRMNEREMVVSHR